MATVECEVEEVDVQDARGHVRAGVRVTCGNCGHVTESFGTTERSTNRCLVLLKEGYPRNENNYYKTDT